MLGQLIYSVETTTNLFIQTVPSLWCNFSQMFELYTVGLTFNCEEEQKRLVSDQIHAISVMNELNYI